MRTRRWLWLLPVLIMGALVVGVIRVEHAREARERRERRVELHRAAAARRIAVAERRNLEAEEARSRREAAAERRREEQREAEERGKEAIREGVEDVRSAIQESFDEPRLLSLENLAGLPVKQIREPSAQAIVELAGYLPRLWTNVEGLWSGEVYYFGTQGAAALEAIQTTLRTKGPNAAVRLAEP